MASNAAENSPAKRVPLSIGDKCTNISNSCDEEGKGLEEEENEVAVLPKRKIIAANEEEIGSNSELKQMDSAYNDHKI